MTEMDDALLKEDRRLRRAREFAAQIMQTLEDFLPSGGTLRRQAYEHLVEAAYKANAVIACLPEEYDKQTDLKIRQELFNRALYGKTYVVKEDAPEG